MQVGAYGWNYADWHNNFYPEDLPEDWRLDFYANTYRVVMVPESEWLAWQQDDVEENLEAVEGDFYFYLEITLSSISETVLNSENKQYVISRLIQVSEQMQTRFAGVVLIDDIEEANVSNQQKQAELDTLLSTELKGYKVTLVSPFISLPGWQWSYENWTCSGEPCAVIAKLSADGKAQASMVKLFEESLPLENKAAPVIVRDVNLSMVELNNLKTITEILGF